MIVFPPTPKKSAAPTLLLIILATVILGLKVVAVLVLPELASSMSAAEGEPVIAPGVLVLFKFMTPPLHHLKLS